MLKVKINDKKYKVEEHSTILEACMANDIKVPTLCYLEGVSEIGACRFVWSRLKDTIISLPHAKL